MAGIKISDLPPNTLPLVGDEQMELENANGDSTRATVADIASSASGLDATFVTITANAALPNERILTEGTNITIVDNGPGNTVVISAAGVSFPLLAPDGTAAAPSYSFTSETNAGMYYNGTVHWAALGRDVFQMDDTGIFGAFVSPTWYLVTDASPSATIPIYTFNNDNDTGIGQNAPDQVSIIAGGNEIARAIEATTLQFAIAPSGNSSVPELAGLTDLDTGFRWPANNETVWIGGGSRAWNFSTAKFYSQFSNGPALMNEISSLTNPTVVPDHSDPNTGIGHGSGGDELSIIAGGIEAIRVEEVASFITVTYFGTLIVPVGSGSQASVGFDGDPDTGYYSPVPDAVAILAGAVEGTRWAEAGGSILKTDQHDIGIVASITQTQGQQPLLSSYNEVTSVANPNDVVTAPSVSAGMRLTIINNGGNDLQVFPASGDNIGGGVDGSITIATGAIGIFLGRDGTDWDTLYNDVPSPSSGATVPDPLLLSSGGVGVPTYSYAADTDTGVYNPALDILGFTAGGVLGLSLAEAGTHVIQTNEEHVGLTASVTQTQAGGLALLSSYNEIATVGTTGDALTAFGVAVGERLVVINNGANDLQLFPAVGDDIGAGVDTAITIVAGGIGIFIGRDATNWDELYNGLSTPGDVFKVGTTATQQVGFWTGDGTLDGDTAFRWDGFNIINAGFGGTIKGSSVRAGAIINETGSTTNPVVLPNVDDLDSGLGAAAADEFSLIAGGVEIARVIEAGTSATDQFFLPRDGDAATPALALGALNHGFYTGGVAQINVAVSGVRRLFVNSSAFTGDGVSIGVALAAGPRMLSETPSGTNPTVLARQNDPDSGLGSSAADAFTGVAGGVQAVDYAEASSRIIQTNANHVGLTASVTQTQAGGLALLSSYNEIATVATTGDALTAFGVAEGTRLVVVNNGANDLQLFPAVGDDIGAGVDTAITVEAGAIGIFLGRTAAIWDTLYNAIASPGGGGGGGLPEFQFFADQFENPVTADWTVNALAPAAADSNNSGLTVRLFDDTVEEGVGFIIEVPATATNIVFDLVSRAETAPGAANTVGLDIYNRGIPDDAAVQAWSVATQLTDIDIPTNEFFQEDSQSVTLASLGITAGETTQLELVRTTPTGGTDLTGDWALLLLKVSFT